MKKLILFVCIYGCCQLSAMQGLAQVRGKAPAGDVLKQAFQHPPEAAKPWVLWYWMQAAVSKAGITADLQAMKQAGIGGANLVTVKGPANPPFINPPVVQLTPGWWEMVRFAISAADRLGLKLAIHDSDGFALAGGPWITPQLSMQKVVWTKTTIQGGKRYNDTITKPEAYKGYYKDISVYAFPSITGTNVSTKSTVPKVTTSLPATDVQFLVQADNKKSFATSDPCWIQMEFDKPFLCRTITIRNKSTNYQSWRLMIQASDDGLNFRSIGRLEPPRHGWQNNNDMLTSAIAPVTARYFRFVYDKEGSEPGSEDLDFAKWKPSLKITGIELSAEPKLHQFESKNGSVWQVSKRTTDQQLPPDLCIDKEKLINISDKLDANGRLNWDAPAGEWTIIRMGHTSTGLTNATGGGGIGLECDKFNPEAITLQFNSWFGEIFKQAGPDLAKRVLKVFYIDSWECGSQNWSPVFRDEFTRRRGYDPLPYLPVMAGVPIESADFSERFLHDVRQTIAELVNDKFYATMSKLAHEKGCNFTAESVAPTMVSDGMLHYSNVDIPMGEFWLRSPTHDKPNDMLDAISGGHIYGKNVIQAEGFTQLRTVWDEHPGMLKAIGDRNLALGVNRLVFHVFTHNPWTDRKPGMTLDGIGLNFQRDQTWWKPGRAWVQYITRCQALLQMGRPVADIAVFTGEETPRRAMMPDRLVPVLPGIFGEKRVKAEAERLANKGVPMRVIPAGVSNTANMPDADKWIDPLRGYAYDSFNRDALLRLATVKNGRITLPGGASYGVLVLPGPTKLSPDSGLMFGEVASKLKHLVDSGAKLIINGHAVQSAGVRFYKMDNGVIKTVDAELWAAKDRVFPAPYTKSDFSSIGIEKDVIFHDSTGDYAEDIAWTHRTSPGFDIYFVSNQLLEQRNLSISFRTSGRVPEIFDPVTGDIHEARGWRTASGRTTVQMNLEPSQALFIVLRKTATVVAQPVRIRPKVNFLSTLKGNWKVQFDANAGGPKQPVIFTDLQDWSKNADSTIRYYSGTAVYTQSFNWKYSKQQDIWLNLGSVANMAEVYVNGISCGVAWTPPYRVNISKALKPGINQLKIEVTNTWANRIMGDQRLPADKRITWTNAPYRLDKATLLPAGIFGPVRIEQVD
jgi:hypothetical protein